MQNIQSLTPSESHRLVPIATYKLVPGIVNGTWILVAEGSVPCENMHVTLEPLVYIKQPEYWRVEAVGSVPGGICLPAVKPYVASLPASAAMGKKGIELVGEGFTQRIDVPPKE